mgnify:CR=1 FL=1
MLLSRLYISLLAAASLQCSATALNLPDNPIVQQRADPFLYRDASSGCYHFTATVPDFSALEIRSACRLQDLQQAEPVLVWHKKASGPMSANIWAPELHRIDQRWYLYFAAGDRERPFHIRMYVLSNDHADPKQGQWREEGQLQTHIDSFALDATTFEHNGQRYLVWAQQDAAATYNSALWLAKMQSPTQIVPPVVKLTEPELDWEVQGYKVNEGPAVLIRHGRVLLTYSASATDERYAIGTLAESHQLSGIYHVAEAGAFDVVLNTLRDVIFHQRNMLVGSCVVDGLGPPDGHEAIHGDLIANRRQEGHDRNALLLESLKLGVNVIQGKFTLLDQQNPFWFASDNLAA